MRLTLRQREAILEETRIAFGPDATVRLFGSRVDDSARGGDIDLHVQAHGSPLTLLRAELDLHARLQRRLGERRIDMSCRITAPHRAPSIDPPCNTGCACDWTPAAAARLHQLSRSSTARMRICRRCAGASSARPAACR